MLTNHADGAWRLLWEALTRLRAEGPTTVLEGICMNATDIVEELYGEDQDHADDGPFPHHATYLLDDLIREWPERNGNPAVYPVEGNDHIYADNAHMWDPAFAFGARRLALLGWLIETVEQRLGKENPKLFAALRVFRKIKSGSREQFRKAHGKERPLCPHFKVLFSAELGYSSPVDPPIRLAAWPQAAGNSWAGVYPIEGGPQAHQEADPYSRWDPATAYGARRYALLDWSIQACETALFRVNTWNKI